MNVPHMRATYASFLEFILEHVDRPEFDHPAPSDQGAYLDFYRKTVRQMSNFWNWKAYWGVKVKNDMFNRIKILHFHGIKPHDYVKKLLGQSCDEAIRHLCRKFKQPIFRLTIHRFLLAASSIPNFHQSYCEASFDTPKKQSGCVTILDNLRQRKSSVKGQSFDQLLPPETPEEKRMRRLVAHDGFWDGDHNGLNKNVVTVSRPKSRLLEEDKTRKVRELSFDYLLVSATEMQENKTATEQPTSLLRLQFRMMLLSGTLSFFFLYMFLRKQRRLLFILVCGSVICRHALAVTATQPIFMQ